MKIEFNEDLLEHNIVEQDGLMIIAPWLLASDVAHEIILDWRDEDCQDVPTNYVFGRCIDMLEDVIWCMAQRVDEILKENDMFMQ